MAKPLQFAPLGEWKTHDPAQKTLYVGLMSEAKNSLKESWAQGASAVQAKKKLDEALKEKSKARIGDMPSACAFTVEFSEGGAVFCVFVEPAILAYDFQRALRDSVGECAGELSAVVLGVTDIELGKKTVEYIASLSVLSEWKAETFGKRAVKKPEAAAEKIQSKIFSSFDGKILAQVAHRGQAVAEATNLVRTLADLPGNELNPTKYQARIENFAKEKILSYEFFGRRQLKDWGAGAFLAVAQSDPDHNCGIAHLHYKGNGGKKLCLVGKGLCFDTGGYNIKTGVHMYNMHRDMTGSAVALAVIGLIAELKLPIEVHAYLAIAENLISPTGFRPNDVVTACDGTTIEVVDTDAEGRMVLADTLAIARRQKADLVLDFATLTGACVRAIDTQRSAVFSNQMKLLTTAVEVGWATGERTWGFPIGEDFWRPLESEVADIRQIAPHNNSDHIYAATFLSHFIGTETPWVHMDLAADTNKGGLGLVATETTGFGARWALGMVEKLLLA